ncbi:MAG: cephalosporin hydroxylase family protein [Proteobacteria bacterium]|nr:cephalosporin hydroxylase family protein [Pseudomonadota bacterium]MDP2105695.1 CmcI family methyltransferase [Desulfobulbaceae bacterium]
MAWQITYEGISAELPPNIQKITFSREDIAKFFHIFFWAHLSEQKGKRVEYNGVPIHKNPGDLLNYQQIIYEQQPDFIIECGAFQGGATLYFANLLDLIGKGQVISIDICEREGVWHDTVRHHPRITCLAGSSTDPAIIDQVHALVGENRNNFIILDSLHTTAHVLGELAAYSDLAGKGNYLIVEDSNLNGHPLPPAWHTQTAMEGGPFEAIEKFLKTRNDFRVDSLMENRFLFSFAPCGYLVKE